MPKSRVPVVFLMARAHPSETASSFVTQGLIDFLVSEHEVARDLRDYVVFKVKWTNQRPSSLFLTLANHRSSPV